MAAIAPALHNTSFHTLNFWKVACWLLGAILKPTASLTYYLALALPSKTHSFHFPPSMDKLSVEKYRWIQLILQHCQMQRLVNSWRTRVLHPSTILLFGAWKPNAWVKAVSASATGTYQEIAMESPFRYGGHLFTCHFLWNTWPFPLKWLDEGGKTEHTSAHQNISTTSVFGLIVECFCWKSQWGDHIIILRLTLTSLFTNIIYDRISSGSRSFNTVLLFYFSSVHSTIYHLYKLLLNSKKN